jgi:hypothetical protein
MGKKKKRGAGATPPQQSLLFPPEEPQAPASPSLAPASAATPSSEPPRDAEEVESPEFLEKIRADAIRWAKDCGLSPPFTVGGPERVSYPRSGYGYVVTLKEEKGKERLGSARFNSSGAPTYWSVDGIVTG